MAKIMVVEDSAEQRNYFAAVLRRGGHDIRFAANGREALQVLAGEAFDMVLTDIFMPECDGIELIRGLRRTNSKMPVVAITGGLNGDHDLYMRMARSFGADLVLSKTHPPQEIAAAVERLLSGQLDPA